MLCILHQLFFLVYNICDLIDTQLSNPSQGEGLIIVGMMYHNAFNLISNP